MDKVNRMVLRKVISLVVTWLGIFTIARGIRAEAAVVSVVESLAGKAVSLPCTAIEHPHRDTPVLLLFYKPSSNIPFYSYDARGGEVWSKGTAKIRDPLYENRVALKFQQPRKVFLNMQKVSLDDQGEFTCRVDFLGSPSLTSVIDLRVYENPKGKPKIYQGKTLARAKEITGVEVGPFHEGDSIQFSCVVLGGHPVPTVTWWQDTILLDNSSKIVPGSPRKVVNGITIGPLTRDLIRVPFTCRSENNPITSPMDKTVHIKIHMAPESVLLPQNPTVKAWVEEGLECRALGSYPQANISWALNGKPLNYTSLETHQEDTDTISRIKFVAKPDDNGAIISCTASSPTLTMPPVTAASSLNVTHAPIVWLQLGSNLQPNEIRQGADVYFDCQTRSNPPLFKIGWYKNDEDVFHDKQGGVLVGGTNLVLQSVQRSDAGNYSCSATNVVGTTKSNTMQLSVQYAPMCAQPKQAITAVEGDVLTLECRVDAHPANVTFFWLFNNTVDSTRFRKSEYLSEGAVSKLRYVAYTARDYGTIYCWAQNVVAPQKDPCAFTLQPAGAPDSVRDCVLTNQSAGSLHITCKPGADGGLTQSFRAEIFTRGAETPVRVLEGMMPIFTVEGLAPGGDYVVRVTALNKKGSSVPISLEAFTLKVAENRMISGVSTSSNPEDVYKPPEEKEISPLLGAITGVITVVVCLSVFALLATRRRWFIRQRSSNLVSEQELDPTVSLSTLSTRSQITKIRSSSEDAKMSQEHIERAPFLNSAVEPEMDPVAEKHSCVGSGGCGFGGNSCDQPKAGGVSGVFTIPANIPPPPQYCSGPCSEIVSGSTSHCQSAMSVNPSNQPGSGAVSQSHTHDPFQYAGVTQSPMHISYSNPIQGFPPHSKVSSHPQMCSHTRYGTSSPQQASSPGGAHSRVCSPVCVDPSMCRTESPSLTGPKGSLCYIKTMNRQSSLDRGSTSPCMSMGMEGIKEETVRQGSPLGSTSQQWGLPQSSFEHNPSEGANNDCSM